MKRFLPLAAGLCFAMLACNQSSDYSANETKDSIEMADSTAVYGNGSSAAAVQNKADTVHRFIRTADLKFQVEHVERTVYAIENIVSQHGGFVTLTQLASSKEEVTTTPVSADSAIETTHATITNTMTVRVPNNRLDTLLKEVTKLVGYLDYRIIKADDVSLQLRANVLQQKRSTQHTTRLAKAIDQQGKKVLETTAAEEILEANATAADEALLANLSLTDKVNFSTVQFSIYQRPTIQTHMVALNKPVDAYEPPFGKRIVAALQNGVEILEELFIGLVQLWPLLLLAGVAVWLYRKYKVGYIAGAGGLKK